MLVRLLDAAVRKALAPAGRARARPQPPAPKHDVPDRDAAARGEFTDHDFESDVGMRHYKRYVPGNLPSGPVPLLVMLHGCRQDPDDFATGTRMNALADRHGFVVVYPAQSRQSNPMGCWNWFQRSDQTRDHGEPALIAGITRKTMTELTIDPSRVFVAGLSAGGAMAVILGESHPELFRAIGVHSGLPFRAARDIASAMRAMRSGPGVLPVQMPRRDGVRTIVFHGDRDTTVNPLNGEAVVEHAVRRFGAARLPRVTDATVDSLDGRRIERSIHATSEGTPMVESWRLLGGAHAWFGGSADGTFTDPAGPNASDEMVRFFLAS